MENHEAIERARLIATELWGEINHDAGDMDYGSIDCVKACVIHAEALAGENTKLREVLRIKNEIITKLLDSLDWDAERNTESEDAS